jgi:hypothetical protein
MKVFIMRLVFVGLLYSLLTISAFSQGFPWEIFKPRTLKEVTELTKKAFRPGDTMYFATNQLETKAEVVFTGKSRPITGPNKTFLSMWAGVYGRPKDYVAAYEREFFYKEGEDEYWLPTQEPVTKYFDKELKPGDKMMIYLISIGAHGVGKDIDCVLLVEEYQVVTPQKGTGKQSR